MNILGIIPARYNSTRFPGKPLADIAGKPMIRRVYEQAVQSRTLREVLVATDDGRIKEAVEGFNGKAMLTKASHRSGTDRCREVVERLDEAGKYYDVIINIQGDEPYINPLQIDELSACFTDPDVSIATLTKRIESEEELFSPHVVKVVSDKFGDAVYFSRHPIPFRQNVETHLWITGFTYYKHIGIYGYKPEILKKITALEPGTLEFSESLEQLRWIENGFKIRVKETPYESHSVDTHDDLLKFFNMG
jgi:3-deoxy-manno-octulosonate cytidylyltransferase (CMP-KDO synthetase)